MPSAVVVGAGVFGTSLARALALAGWEVTLAEQASPGHDGSSSRGETRLIRCSHGSERWYTRSARRAWQLWHEIDPSLVVDCGVAWFAQADGGWESESEAELRREGIPVERLDPGDAARLFPSLGLSDLHSVLFEPEAGVLLAGRAIRELARQAKDAGARIVQARVRPGDERVLDADHVIWACGPWLGKLFPDLVELRVTRQDVRFFECPPEWLGTPGWVDYSRSAYGNGDVGHGFKAAPDAEGPAADPDALGRPDSVSEAVAREYLALRFPALADAPVRSAHSCPYELTADTHFIAAPHPEQPHWWLLGGGSGHGFKHGPPMAELMLGWLTGAEAPDPRFALGPRNADQSLRTAGARATPIGRKLPES
jgi:glycine/D-amino acid oxidase-like deaminating enzyme